MKTLDGRIKRWIDVGRPSAERLHKASKAAQSVAVCTDQDPAAFRRTLAGARIHRAEAIELVSLPASLIAPLEAQVERRMDWELTITGGQIYIASAGETLAGEITRTALQ